MRRLLCLSSIFLLLACTGGETTGTQDPPADAAAEGMSFPDRSVGLEKGAPKPDGPQKNPDGPQKKLDGPAVKPDGPPKKPDAGKPPVTPTKLTLLVNIGDSHAAGYYATKGNAYKALLVKNNDLLYPTHKGKDLSTRFPGAVTMVMLNIYDPTDGVGSIPNKGGLTGFCKTILKFGLVGGVVVNNLALFNKELAKFAAANKVIFADQHARFLGHGFNHADPKNKHHDKTDPTLWFYKDCAQANNRGHHEVRRLIWTKLFGK